MEVDFIAIEPAIDEPFLVGGCQADRAVPGVVEIRGLAWRHRCTVSEQLAVAGTRGRQLDSGSNGRRKDARSRSFR